MKKSFTYLAIFCFSFCAALVLFLFYLDYPVRTNSEPVRFTITRGSSVRSIVSALEDENLVRSQLFALAYTRAASLVLKAGSFMLDPSLSTSALLKQLSDASPVSARVTLPEGLTLGKTAAYLEEAGVVNAKSFVTAAQDRALLTSLGITGSTAEGFLFPDTYFFDFESDPDIVIRQLVANFFRKTVSFGTADMSASDLYQKVILASIIEREYRVVEEAPLIAGVFYNRLKIGMGLQSCATIEYIITEIQGGEHPSRLLKTDLEIISDYNTYMWAGLPPGPISSPGLVALDAAINPVKSQYLYFRLTDPEQGTHSFTRSLDEHVDAGRMLPKRAAGN